MVEKDGAVVALLVLEDEWIDQLYVDPDFVGDGLGSSLIAVAKAERPGGLKAGSARKAKTVSAGWSMVMVAVKSPMGQAASRMAAAAGSCAARMRMPGWCSRSAMTDSRVRRSVRRLPTPECTPCSKAWMS